jgi:hypothetical protein
MSTVEDDARDQSLAEPNVKNVFEAAAFERLGEQLSGGEL